MKTSFFVTGTDTEVGKTTIACALLAKAKDQSLTTAAIKPVASGCVQVNQTIRNSDALALWEHTTVELTYSELNPIAFLPAIAPHIAAKEAGIDLSVETLATHIKHVLAKEANFSLVEGAGGWRVPLNEQTFLSDLVKVLQLPVILVVGIKLGCINHALLTVDAIKRDGLVVAGWVANVVDSQTARLNENIDTLMGLLKAPCLGVVPYLEKAEAVAIANYLTLDPLLEAAR